MATRVIQKKVQGNKVADIVGTFASASRFEVEFLGMNDWTNENAKAFVKSVELPQVERKTTDFGFDGINVPLAREVTYKNTTDIVFYMDEMGTRERFINWLGGKGDVFKEIDPETYSNAIIRHYTSGGTIKESLNSEAEIYKLENIFPINVGSVQLSSDSNSILEYTVTFMYATWKYGEEAESNKDTMAFPPVPSNKLNKGGGIL